MFVSLGSAKADTAKGSSNFMRRKIARTVTGVAIVAGLVAACGSEGENGAAGTSGANGTASSAAAASSSGAGAPASSGAGTGDAGQAGGEAAQKVTAAIQQALQQSPITFTTESAELTEKSKTALGEIAKAMQGNDVKITVATHAGYPDAEKSKALSEKRAEAITAALEAAGVAKDRVKTEATGNEKAQGDQALDTQITVAQ
ncbi:OmpA family protein [Amycolatopsis roodepoortensis]|uniref:Outer membrane protein OmpA-like peptidoglycan-associated protein n=1 Tax=Amycolatopsis roodepoortensis TaxID=700274 RepID=A0ABR9L0W5_9PSEU|nr:OmpA family protein [Amycolatopsis roodepoortensis]MBE1574238.1 outer membrane protein OmpA-like peptidoglycan-associated protein [Amycolatopsis roodepoortensis]UUV31464.1 OmpA family protein [Amycolatopsis roodepoortensis]